MNILDASVHEMVEYLNEQRLVNGLSVKEICRINSISYTTVQKKYNKEYIYNKTTKKLEARGTIKDVPEKFSYQYESLLQEELQELREIIDQLRDISKPTMSNDAEKVLEICKTLSEEDMKMVMEQLNKQYSAQSNNLDISKLKGQLSGNGEFYSTKLDTNIKARWIAFTAEQLATVQELTQLAFHELMERNGY